MPLTLPKFINDFWIKIKPHIISYLTDITKTEKGMQMALTGVVLLFFSFVLLTSNFLIAAVIFVVSAVLLVGARKAKDDKSSGNPKHEETDSCYKYKQ